MCADVIGSGLNVSRIGRVLRVAGIIAVVYGTLAAGDYVYLYFVGGVLTKPNALAGAASFARDAAAGMLAWLAGNGLVDRSEPGRVLAERAALVSFLFGLTDIAVALIRGDATNVLPSLGALAFAALGYSTIRRADVRAQCDMDSRLAARRQLGGGILIVVAVVIVATGYIRLTSELVPEVGSLRQESTLETEASPPQGGRSLS